MKTDAGVCAARWTDWIGEQPEARGCDVLIVIANGRRTATAASLSQARRGELSDDHQLRLMLELFSRGLALALTDSAEDPAKCLTAVRARVVAIMSEGRTPRTADA